MGAGVVLAACVGRPASDASTGSEAAELPTIARSGNDYEWINSAHPACPGEPHPGWDPTAAGQQAAHDGDAGVSSDARAAGMPSNTQISNATKVVSEMRPGFRDCYVRALDRNAQAGGSVRLAFRVNCEGFISRIRGRVNGRLDEDAIRCMFSVAKNARFEPPHGGAAVVNIPVNLVSMSPSAAP